MVPSEGLHFTLRGADRHIDITCTRSVTPLSGLTFYVALQLHADAGAAVIPFDAHFEGSTVFLPFRATHFHFIAMSDTARRSWQRHFDGTMWSARAPGIVGATEAEGERRVRLRIPLPEDPRRSRIRVAVYAKEISENCGWGRMLPSDDGAAPGGYDDQYLRAHYSVTAQEITLVPHRIAAERVKIYQLFPRLFSNLTATCEQNGALDTNGAGKFSQINDAALRSLRAMNFTHLWLTGILRQATGSDFSTVGLPADDPDLLKGIAGSPYAITDYFDVSPELADDPAKRLEEFCALVARIKAHRFGLIIDFVANHVARSYRSTIRPELTFGAGDDRTRFFDPQNNFYHLHGGGLRLPTWKDGAAISSTCKVLGTCDGLFDLEREQARVTGNDVASREPKLYDWYETVKLNYGYDFTTRQREYPHGEHRQKAVPDTWWKMDRVLEYWQTRGVDGFRCDMAHMVPPEFWAWCIGRARARADDVLFIAEAYNNDPMKVVGGDPLLAALDEHRGSVMFDLLNAGFSAVYDDPAYRRLKAIYDGGGWANDLDAAFGHDFIFHNALRYAENHDEVRLAARGHWDSIGMRVGRAVSGILYALSRGPVLLYNGQEVGEPAAGAEGFGGDDARTTIFDYWSMPELRKWVSEHRYDGADLSPEQHDLRAFYAKLLRLVSEPAFQHGEFFALNRFNIDNPRFGRLFDESASGHWLYAFLRRDQTSGQAFLVATNLHRSETMQEVSVRLPAEAVGFLALSPNAKGRFMERLSAKAERSAVYRAGSGAVDLGDIPPLTPCYFELQIPSAGG